MTDAATPLQTPPLTTGKTELTVAEGLSVLMPELRKRARQLTRSESLADDLVQDTVERALRFQESFHRGGYLRAWLFRIMQNVFISGRRRIATERRVLEGAKVDPNGWATLEPSLMQPGLSPPVSRALEELPEHLASVIKMVDLSEASYKEAAHHESVPVGTIMSRLHRGRAKLRSSLAVPLAA